MNIKQLKLIDEMVKCNFSVTKTAEKLFSTQPGISAQLKALEDELGLSIFHRHGKRILALTPAGENVHQYAQQALISVEAIKRVANDYSREESGSLSIATTHTQARYALPDVIKRFSKRYPAIQLSIHQGNPTQITNMVAEGEADFAIATEGIANNPQLAMLPVYQWNRCIIAPKNHPILKRRKITLQELAQHPIVTYDFAFAGRSVINRAFVAEDLQPKVVLTALDSDVIKTYVELGLGIGIVASMAYNKTQDKNLSSKDASHLFDDSTTYIGFKKGQYLRSYMLDFIQWFSPNTTKEAIYKSNQKLNN